MPNDCQASADCTLTPVEPCPGCEWNPDSAKIEITGGVVGQDATLHYVDGKWRIAYCGELERDMTPKEVASIRFA